MTYFSDFCRKMNRKTTKRVRVSEVFKSQNKAKN